jgi:hypothetical protein
MCKEYCILILTALFISEVHCQNIINGDFENNTGSCLINIPNATYNINMYNSTAFGTFENLDIVENGCSVVNAQSGQFCIFIAVGNVDTNFQEAISLELSAPLQAGTSYTLSFYDKIISGFSTASVKIGVAVSNNTFGNFIYSVPAASINNAWTMRTINFVSPINAGYLTVTVGGPVLNSGDAIDNFQLSTASGIDNNSAAETDLIFFPLPFSTLLNVNLNNNQPSEIILYDIASRKLLQKKFTSAVTLNTEQLVKGFYLYEVRNKMGMIKKGRVVKD